MERNIKGLVSAGHEMASELKAECGAVDMRSVAKLISDLATQLEVQLVRANALAEDHQRAIESIKQADAAVKLAHEKFSALAAENARYSMSAGQADQRMSESCAVREALGFNRSADDVSPSDLVDKIKSIIAECDAIRSAHPQPLGPVMDAAIDAFNAEEMPETGMLNAYFILRDSITVQTPSTDAFLAEVRARGVEMFAASLKVVGGQEHPYSSLAHEFATQLRKGGTREQDDYQALRAKAEKATCGEWSLEYGKGRFDGDDALIHREVAGYIPICRIEGAHPESGFDEDFQTEQQANAEFIAAANPATVLALLDERESQNKRIAELEKSEEQLINERDHAESALDDMYFAATGNRPEWSNWFGFSDAVDAVVDRIADLETKQPSPVVPEGLIKAVRFYEQVKRENPPVETGAWKDAVDWVLKEACQSVNIGIKGD